MEEGKHKKATRSKTNKQTKEKINKNKRDEVKEIGKNPQMKCCQEDTKQTECSGQLPVVESSSLGFVSVS